MILKSRPRRKAEPGEEPPRSKWRDLTGYGPLALAMIALFIAVALPSDPEHRDGPASSGSGPILIPFEPVPPPSVDLSPRFEPVEPPPYGLPEEQVEAVQPPAIDLSPRLEPIWPPPRRPDGQVPAGRQGVKRELPLFVQAVDRQIEEERLLREIAEADVTQGSTTSLGPEPGLGPDADPVARTAEGRIESFKRGMSSAADGLETLIFGGPP